MHVKHSAMDSVSIHRVMHITVSCSQIVFIHRPLLEKGQNHVDVVFEWPHNLLTEQCFRSKDLAQPLSLGKVIINCKICASNY